MPKTIDQRVVEMQFDNKNFEKNVATSMSTLDRLKEKLNFRGASRAIEELNGSMKGFNVSPIETALDGIGSKFSVFEQIAIGALRKIGEEAFAAGEKLVKSLSIDNIEAGWQKYGEKTTSVATLVAQGNELEKVEEELEKLNFFTDETSYNFVDMVSNIGKFTASGKNLEESITAMQGIATWAALSGQNAATASRAMYQLSQAMGAGIMRKEDYKSIQNASMDSQEFRKRTIDAAIALGKLEEVSEGVYHSLAEDAKGELFTIDQFADSLTYEKWFDSDVMMTVYKDYGKASNTLIKYMDKYTDKLSTASEAMDDIENKAQALVDSGKAASMDEALQKISLDELMEIPELVSEATDFMNEYNSNLKEGETQITNVYDALLEMGYGLDEFSLKAFRAAQEARTWNDVLDSVRDAVSTGWMNSFQSIFGNQKEATKLWTRMANDFWDIFASGGEDRNTALSYWNNWIEPFKRNLVNAATGLESEAWEMFQKDIEDHALSGRELLFSTDENNLGAIIELLQSLKDIIQAIKDAWNDTFYGTTDADEVAWQKADMLMSITKSVKAFADSLKKLTDQLNGDNEVAKKFRSTLKGVFAIIDIIAHFIKTGFAAAWELLSTIIGGAGGSVLDFTASIGDNIVAFRDWIKENESFEKGFETISNAIKGAIDFIKNLIDAIIAVPAVSGIIDRISKGFSGLFDVVTKFSSNISSGTDFSVIFDDLVNGIKNLDGIGPVIQTIIDAFTNLWNFISEKLSGANFDLSNTLKWIAILGAVVAGIILLSRDTNEANKTVITVGGVITALAGVILALTLFADPAEISNAVKSLSLLMGVFAIILLIAKDITGMSNIVSSIAGVILILAGALVALSALPTNNVFQNAIALSLILGVFALIVSKMAKIGKDVNSDYSSISAIRKYAKIVGVLALEMSGALFLLGLLPTGRALQSAIAVSILMKVIGDIVSAIATVNALVTFSTVVNKAMKVMSFGKMEVPDAIDYLKQIAHLMWEFMAILALMSMLPTQNAITNAFALTILLGAIIGALFLLTRMDEAKVDLKKSLKNIALLGLVALELGFVLAIVSGLDGMTSIQNAIAITILLGALTVVLTMASLFGDLSTRAMASLAVVSGVVLVLSGIILGLSFIPAENVMPNVLALSLLLGTLSLVLLAMIPVGIFAAAALAGTGVMLLFIVAMGALLAGIGWLEEQFDLSNLINNSIPLLEAIGFAIGDFIGSIIGGIGAGASNALAIIGANLVMFGASLAPFMASIEQVTPEKLAGVSELVKAVMMLTAAEFLQTITSFVNMFAGNEDYSFADSLVNFGNGVKAFYESIEDIEDVDKLKNAAIAAQSLSDIVDAMPRSGGWMQAIVGESMSLTEFGEELVSFAPKIVKFCEIIQGGQTKIDQEAVKAAVAVGQLVSGLAANLPKHGGLVQLITGDNSLTEFGVELLNFAPKIVRFCEIIMGGSTHFDEETVKAAVACASLVSGFAEKLPKHGGVVQWFMGDANLTDFGNELLSFAPSIVEFARIIQEGGTINQKAIEAAVNAAGLAAGLEENLPKTGGFLDFFTGSADLSEFAADLPLLGVGIKNFSDNIIGIDPGAMDAALSALDVLTTIENNLPESGNVFTWLAGQSKDLDGFVSDMPKFAEGIKTFSNTLTSDGGIDSAAVSAAANTLSAITELSQASATIGNITNVATVTSQLTPIAENLKSYSDILEESTNFSDGAMDDIATSIRTLSGLEKELAYTDYKKISSAFTELNSLVGLLNRVTQLDSDKIKAFGEVMSNFGQNGLTEFLNSFSDNDSKLNDAADIILNSFSRGIKDNQGLFSDAFTSIVDSGISTIRERYQDMVDVGSEAASQIINGMKATLEDSDSGIGGAVKSSVGGLNIQDIIQQAISGDGTGTDSGDMVSKLISSYQNANIPGAFSENGEIGKEFGEAGSNAIGALESKITSSDSVNNIKNELVSAFTGLNLPSTFEDTGEIGKIFSESGSNSISAYTSSIASDEAKANIESAGKQIGINLINGYKTSYEDISQAGKNSVDGLLNAIKDMAPQAQAAGEKIATALTSGIEIQLQIASPSKVMYGIGEYAGEGFVNALADYVAITNQVGGDLGDSATNGIRDALAKSADMFDTSVDIEPTIRPVLDLSNIDQGIGQLDGMFNANRSIELAGNTAISMDGRASGIQNEITVDNKDVVSAIRELRGDMGELADRFSKLQVILDTNVLVGQLTDPMDTALGSRVNRRKRG